MYKFILVLPYSFLKYVWGVVRLTLHPVKNALKKSKSPSLLELKWFLVRCSHPADHHPEKIRKIDEISADELDFNAIKPPVKIKDIHNIEKYNSINIGAFGYENKKNIQSMYL